MGRIRGHGAALAELDYWVRAARAAPRVSREYGSSPSLLGDRWGCLEVSRDGWAADAKGPLRRLGRG